MSPAGVFRTKYLVHFSQPAFDRPIYRLIARNRFTSVLELGMGDGVRSGRMLELMACRGVPTIRFVGIDLFEDRSPACPGMTLKLAYLAVNRPGVKVRLIPGHPWDAFQRMANELGRLDLIVISADQNGPSLEQAWFYVPRLIHEGTFVVWQNKGSAGLIESRIVPHDEIQNRALRAVPRRRAA